jgi:phosphomannomutase
LTLPQYRATIPSTMTLKEKVSALKKDREDQRKRAEAKELEVYNARIKQRDALVRDVKKFLQTELKDLDRNLTVTYPAENSALVMARIHNSADVLVLVIRVDFRMYGTRDADDCSEHEFEELVITVAEGDNYLQKFQTTSIDGLRDGLAGWYLQNRSHI